MTHAVVVLRHLAPTIKAARMAEILGISGEAVRQALQRNGLPTKMLRPKKLCERCKEPLSDPKYKVCRACHAVKVWLVCEVCGTGFFRPRGEVNAARKKGYRHIFCPGRKCQGKWLGRQNRRKP